MSNRNKNAESAGDGRVVVENVNCPGLAKRVDAAKYEAVRRALVKMLPHKPPGLTQGQMMQAVKPHLSEDLFPGGAKSDWWTKTVQLDLEAKRLVARTKTKPLQWYLTEPE